MGSFEDAVQTLEVELLGVEQAFRDLTSEQWRTPTKLQPLETPTSLTLFELPGFDISSPPESGRAQPVSCATAPVLHLPRSGSPRSSTNAFKMFAGKTP